MDALCIVWLMFVWSNPWAALVNTLKMLKRFIITVLVIVPIVYGLVLWSYGANGVFGQVCLAYTMELVGTGALFLSLLTLDGIWEVMRGTFVVYCLMISVPCWFILGSLVYFTW